MHYTVRHFDLPLLEFEADMDSAETNLRIVKGCGIARSRRIVRMWMRCSPR